MDSPPPPPVVAAAAPAPVAKAPWVFPKDEVLELLSESKASALETIDDEASIDRFNRLSAFVTVIEGETIESSFLAYAKSIIESAPSKNPQVLAECGIFGPTTRFKTPPAIDGSIGLTPHALFSGCKAACLIKETFEIEAQQLPGIFFVAPTKPEESGTSLWGFYDDASPTAKVLDDECVPIALVAWTPVKIHFVPHSDELRSKWTAITAGGGFNGHKPKATPLFRKELEGILVDWHCEQQETISWTLSPGQVFVTHRGMPFCFSAADDCTDYVVQAVGFEVLKPNNKSKQWWRNALTTGLWKYDKDPVNQFCALALPFEKEKTRDGYEPSFTPMTVEAAEWLTGGAPIAKKRKPASSSSATSVVSASPTKKEKKDKKEEEEKEEEEPKKKKAVAAPPESKLAECITLHDTYIAEIAALPPKVWDVSFEKHVNEHRSANDTAKNKITSYQKCLASLKGKIETARKNAEKVGPIVAQLNECKAILDGLQIADGAVKLAKSLASIRKEYDTLDKSDNIIIKSNKIAKLLERCKKFKEDVDADNSKKAERKAGGGTKRSRGGATGGATGVPRSPLPDSFDPIDEEAIEPDERSGDELSQFVSMIDEKIPKFDVMVKGIDRPDIRSIYDKFYKEVAYLRTQLKEWPNDSVNIAIISAYYDQLLGIWEKTAATPAASLSKKAVGSVTLENGATITFGNGKDRVECNGPSGDGCGEPKIEYANGMCFDCFKDMVKDLEGPIVYASQELPKLIAKAIRIRGPIKGKTRQELEECEKRNKSFIAQIDKEYKRFKRTKDAVAPMLNLIDKGRDNIREVLGAEFLDEEQHSDGGVGRGDDEEEEAYHSGAEAMDVDADAGDSSRSAIVDDDDEEGILEQESDAASYASGSDDDEDDDDVNVEEGAAVRSKNGKSTKKRSKVEGEQEENLADAILRAQIRTPIEEYIKKLTTAYFKGDPDSLGAVRSGLKELSELTKIFGFKTKAKGSSAQASEWPNFFESEEKALEKQAYYEKRMPGLEFTLHEKDI